TPQPCRYSTILPASMGERFTRRRAREKFAEDIDTLFAALPIAEKRGVLAALGGAPAGTKLNDAESVEKAIIESGRSVGEILQKLRHSEISVPKKHFFLATAEGSVGKAVTAATREMGKHLAANVVLSYQADLGEVVCFL